jgi:hypothetical protein
MNRFLCVWLVFISFTLLAGCSNKDAQTEQQKADHDALWKTSPATSTTAGTTAGPLIPNATSTPETKN